MTDARAGASSAKLNRHDFRHPVRILVTAHQRPRSPSVHSRHPDPDVPALYRVMHNVTRRPGGPLPAAARPGQVGDDGSEAAAARERVVPQFPRLTAAALMPPGQVISPTPPHPHP